MCIDANTFVEICKHSTNIKSAYFYKKYRLLISWAEIQEELHHVKKSYMYVLFLPLPYNPLVIFIGMRAPDWAMNNIRTLQKKYYV